MLTREAFEHEIRRFEKEIANELTEKSKETLWNFFSMKSVKFMKETLAQSLENIENFRMSVKGGAPIPVSKPKDIQALFNIMDAMHAEMIRQNESWLRICKRTNYTWSIIYLMILAAQLFIIL
jgi:hypothetical protein